MCLLFTHYVINFCSRGELAGEETSPDMIPSETPMNIGEKAGLISVIQSTADKFGIGSIFGNKKKKPTTTPSPYKGDADAKPSGSKSDGENPVVKKEEDSTQETNKNSVPGAMPFISKASMEVDGKTGLTRLVAGKLETVPQAESQAVESAENIVDEKTGIRSTEPMGSSSPVNQDLPVAGSPAGRSLDVGGKTGLAGLLGGSVSTILQTGATISETAGLVIDNKVAGLGGLLGSQNPINHATAEASSNVAK